MKSVKARRAIVSLSSLRAMLSHELAMLEGCEGVEIGEVHVLPVPDADGCNWNVTPHAGSAHPGSRPSLADCLIQIMRAQYNVSHSS